MIDLPISEALYEGLQKRCAGFPKLTPTIRAAYTPAPEETAVEPISHKYRDSIMRMMATSSGQSLVTDKNVHQVGKSRYSSLYRSHHRGEPSARIGHTRNAEHLDELLRGSQGGEACLLLLEHYSNFDLPVFHYLLRKRPGTGQALADALLAVAGIKLNESNPAVLAFTEAYSRLVIYPSRSLEIIKRNLKDPKELLAEIMRSATVNRAAMRSARRAEAYGTHRPRIPLRNAIPPLGSQHQAGCAGDRFLREVLRENVLSSP